MKTYGKVTGMIAAIAAVAVSGIALAQPDPDRVTGKDKHKDAPGTPKTKTSVELVNMCKPVNQYINAVGDTVKGTFLKVTSTITNESGDGIEDDLTLVPSTDMKVSQIHVGGLQLVKSGEKPPKKEWKAVGAVDYTPNADITIPPEESKDFTVYLDLCHPVEQKLDPNAIALNAEVQIMIYEGDDKPARNFIGNCDDPDIYDDIDQSRIDLDDPNYSWINCP
jgi:hypothetical protein